MTCFMIDRARSWAPLRAPEDEGGGGGGSAPAPAEGGNDLVRALQERLDRMSGQIGAMTREREQSRVRDELQGHKATLSTRVRDAEDAISQAERALAGAYDDSDGAAIAKAQRALSEAVSRRDQAKFSLEAFNGRLADAERAAKEAPGELNTANLDSWKSRHSSWYGVDTELTREAHRVAQQIEANGVIATGSRQYFEAIDREMANRHPDKFRGAPELGSGARGGAGASASAGRIPNSIVEGWRRMGIDVNDPVVIKRMMQNRQTAVDKGLLPAEMSREQVRMR